MINRISFSLNSSNPSGNILSSPKSPSSLSSPKLPISQFFNPWFPNSSMSKASNLSYLLHPASKCQRNLSKNLTGRKISQKWGIARSKKILPRIQTHL